MAATDSLEIVDTLRFVADSLFTINDSIDAGVIGYEDEQLALENYIDGLTHLRLTSADLSGELELINSDLKEIISDIESGLVKLDQLFVVNTGLDSVYTDSATSYYAPLDMTTEETELSITLNATSYSLILGYELFDEVDIDRRIIRQAMSVSINSHSFDSVQIACDSVNFDCNSNDFLAKETILTCYF